MADSQMRNTIGSSSNPLLIDGLLARDDAVENDASAFTRHDSGKRSSSHISLLEEEQEPPAKKLTFEDEVGSSQQAPLVPYSGGLSSNEVLNQVPSDSDYILTDAFNLDDFLLGVQNVVSSSSSGAIFV